MPLHSLRIATLLAGLSAIALLFPGLRRSLLNRPARLNPRLHRLSGSACSRSSAPASRPRASRRRCRSPAAPSAPRRTSPASTTAGATPPPGSATRGCGLEADDLLAALADAPADGLDPERYRLADLRQRLAQVKGASTPGDLAEIDLRLTDAFLRLAADLRNGAVNPQLIYPDCELDIPEVDLSAVLEDALAAGRLRRGDRRARPRPRRLPRAQGRPRPDPEPRRPRRLARRAGWPAPAPRRPQRPGGRPARPPRSLGGPRRGRLASGGARPPRRPPPGRPAQIPGPARPRSRRRRQGHPGGPERAGRAAGAADRDQSRPLALAPPRPGRALHHGEHRRLHLRSRRGGRPRRSRCGWSPASPRTGRRCSPAG